MSCYYEQWLLLFLMGHAQQSLTVSLLAGCYSTYQWNLICKPPTTYLITVCVHVKNVEPVYLDTKVIACYWSEPELAHTRESVLKNEL